MAPDGSRHQDPTDDEELLELLHESACRVPLPNTVSYTHLTLPTSDLV